MQWVTFGGLTLLGELPGLFVFHYKENDANVNGIYF